VRPTYKNASPLAAKRAQACESIWATCRRIPPSRDTACTYWQRTHSSSRETTFVIACPLTRPWLTFFDCRNVSSERGAKAEQHHAGPSVTMANEVTIDDWREIVNNAKKAAKGGDAQARAWLSNHLIGKPHGSAPTLAVVVDRQGPGALPRPRRQLTRDFDESDAEN
jgi:hypothetical protein